MSTVVGSPGAEGLEELACRDRLEISVTPDGKSHVVGVTFAQHAKFRDARDQGLSEFGSAKSPDAIDAVITNTMIQGVLSVVFASLVIVVVIAAAVTCVRAVRTRGAGGEVHTSEEANHPSTLFVPRGMVATKEEKEVASKLRLLDDAPTKAAA